jgi:uncharacterized protein (TIGR02145 family)
MYHYRFIAPLRQIIKAVDMNVRKKVTKTAAAIAVAVLLGCGGKGDDKDTRAGASPDTAGATLAAARLAGTQNTFADARDGKIYRTVKIGEQVWMAENLNYQTDSSWCYDDDTSNCNKYGRLYNWNAAMKACPAGWHLPSWKEWVELGTFADSGGIKAYTLKSKPPDWDGTDDYGFAAMPGGYRALDIKDGSFYRDLGVWSWLWTATDTERGGGGSRAYRKHFYSGSWLLSIESVSHSKSCGLSVRCLQGVSSPNALPLPPYCGSVVQGGRCLQD